MTEVVTFPCEYLTFSTGYENELLKEEFMTRFSNFCAQRAVIPIAIYDIVYTLPERPVITILPIRNGRITITADITEYEDQLANELGERLFRNNLARAGGVILRVGNFENASKVFLDMDVLEYCVIDSLGAIKFLHNAQGAIDLVCIEANARDDEHIHPLHDVD